jgi:SAM-dependent methyltransferase
MGASGPTFYDDDAVFVTYMQHRRRPDNPNDTLEKPVMLELIGSPAGRRILDLGCGDAAIGRELLERGALYVGVEGSQRMADAAAQALAGTSGKIVRHTIEDWTYPSAAFDLVIARLVLHYMADLASLCAQVYQTLIPGGQLIFSVEHPVITSCDRGWPAGSPRQDWVVDNYFDTGLRVTNWLGGTVEKYHRTVEDYFRTLQGAGFIVEQLRESRPERQHFQDEATYERRRRIPLFLFLAGRKP